MQKMIAHTCKWLSVVQ